MFGRLLLATITLAAFARAPLSGLTRPAGPGKRLTPLRLIAFFHYPPLVAAQELGYFADENLAVYWEITPNPAAFAAVRDLRVELGLAPPPGPPIESHYDLSLYEQARR